jgi:mono/diheme cytochrome c family protein
MKKSILIFAIVAFSQYKALAQNLVQGENLFKASCVACHTIGSGKIIGPDLVGIGDIRNEKWLINFIRSSQTMIKNNDPIAVKVFNEYNKIPMPDNNFTDAQIKDILAYIKSKSPAKKTAAKPVPRPTGSATSATAPKPAPTPAPKAPPAPVWVNAEHQIRSVKATESIDPKNLKASLWENAPAVKLPVAIQNVVYPHLAKGMVEEISVKSACFGNQLAFLVEWKDESRNVEVDIDRFSDQLAVQLPVDVNNIPSFMMGNSGGKVHIVHWKAVWQEDCENGFRDVQDVHPNMWVDVYPGLESYLDRSNRIFAKDITSEHIVDTRMYAYMPGTYSRNYMSQIKRKEPVEESSAQGFGTLTTQETQSARGWAEWSNGQWKVCVVVPINTGNIYKAAFKDKTKVAFAIWDGGNEEIGGRKHYSQWVDVLLEN